jgi:hypothetical protein
MRWRTLSRPLSSEINVTLSGIETSRSEVPAESKDPDTLHTSAPGYFIRKMPD